jgi:hypothetical protein
LKRSLAADAPKPAPAAKEPRKRIEGQGEMLLPISGKAPPKATAQKQTAPRKPSKSPRVGRLDNPFAMNRRRSRHLTVKRSDGLVGISSIAAICGVALYFVPASAAVVGQTVSVGNATMACPGVAALERFKKMSPDNPARASKDALTAGCREVSPSERGLTNKVAGANLCVIFSTESGRCLWISAAAPSGRINRDANQDLGSGLAGGLQKLFGGSH